MDDHRKSSVDPLQIYYKKRQELNRVSSSIGVIDLNRLSSLDSLAKYLADNNDQRLSTTSETSLFKKPNEEPPRMLTNFTNPMTPRVFHDELDSITPDDMSAQFVSNPDEALQILEKDEQNFDRPSFAQSASCISDRVSEGNLSMGEYFGKCSDRLSSIIPSSNKGSDNSVSVVRRILSEADSCISNTILCDKLLELDLNKAKTPLGEISANLDHLSESRQSTPIRVKRETLVDLKRLTAEKDTPQLLNQKKNWERRVNLLNAPSELEKSVANGDLTIISQRINSSLKEQSLKIDAEPTFLRVVRKLANFPNGSVDCSALTPLMREQYPELLETLEEEEEEGDWENAEPQNISGSFDPGQWIKHKRMMKVKGCVDTWQTVTVPLSSQNRWLLLSPVELIHKNKGGKSYSFENGEACLSSLMTVKLKDFAIPPNTQYSFKIHFLPHKSNMFDLCLCLNVTDLETEEIQNLKLCLQFTAIFPTDQLKLSPALPVNFETIADSCLVQKQFKLIFDGSFALPVRISIDSEGCFKFGRNVKINGKDFSTECEDLIELMFVEGEKQILEFPIEFYPTNIKNLQEKGSVDFTGDLNVFLITGDDSLKRLLNGALCGTVAFAKFLCSPEFTPTVFRTAAPGIPQTKSFPLKNVGKIPITLTIRVLKNNRDFTSTDNHLFKVPDQISLQLNEQTAFPILFTGETDEPEIKRFLVFRFEPNGKTQFEVPLHAIVAKNPEKLLSSASSVKSASTGVSAFPDSSVPIKLVSTKSCVSWPSVEFNKESVVGFQIKNICDVVANARMCFANETATFKIINEKGEAISKMRRYLKPNVATSVNIMFKPCSLGLEVNELIIETNQVSKISKIPLIGYGGAANLVLKDISTDLSGQNTIHLIQPDPDSTFYNGQMRIFNSGNISGFVSIRSSNHVPRISQDVRIFPQHAVIPPNKSQIFSITQHVSRFELNDLLADSKNIRKLATLSLIFGDEPSRLRARKMLEENPRIKISPNVKELTDEFSNEVAVSWPSFSDSKDFQSIFLSSLTSEEVVVLLQQCVKPVDYTLVEGEECHQEFHTLSSTVLSCPQGSMIEVQCDQSPPSSQKVTEWLNRQS